MENNFLKSLKNVSNETKTDNGAFALKSTNNELVDLFASIGAMRNKTDIEIMSSFITSLAVEPLLTMKTLFYARNIRGGLGERKTFRTIIRYLADTRPELIQKNIKLIPEFGRWDDLYSLVGTKCEYTAFELMHKQFINDLNAIKEGKLEKVSLLGKWLKSTNTSSKESRKLGKLTAKWFATNPIKSDLYNEIQYRKNLSALRNAIKIVERKMSANEWDKIEYDKLPSKAAQNYSEAFLRHDKERYEQYKTDLMNGITTINASALYPYDISKFYIGYNYDKKDDSIHEAQWKALPNYITRNKDFLIMADTSGSMCGIPMQTSVGLAVYFAERNKGFYHNKFMTFSANPELISLNDNMNLREKFTTVLSANWGMNTNLEAAFNMVLSAAVRGKLKQEELPEALVVITDMQIDEGSRNDTTFTDTMKEKFKNAGYEMPILVWWNVNASHFVVHSDWNDESVRFVSGHSPVVFKGLCENLGYNAMELILSVLNNKIYDRVKI